jgi:hypothetical protein
LRLINSTNQEALGVVDTRVGRWRTYKPETRIRGTIGWVGIALLLVYLFSSYAIYPHGR